MPVIVIKDEKPTFIAKPDMRFATSFLSLRFRDYAVKGEALMDKATGELYHKRTEDGRVVSFFQNKKFLHELMLENYILFTVNAEFNYPRTNDDAYFLCTDYDSMSLFEEQRLDILTSDAIVKNDETDTTTEFKFNLSTETNGFFIRATSRDCDKSLVQFLTTEYNKLIKNYDGDDPLYLAEKEKADTIEKWYDSNAVIEYTVKVTKGDMEVIYTDTDYIRINERCCVFIPYVAIHDRFPNGYDSCLITIKSIHYDKIHFMIDHLSEFSEEFMTSFNNLKYPDDAVYVDYYNIEHFIDSASQIVPLGNEFYVALIDVGYMKRYIGKVQAIKDSNAVNISIERPNDPDWHANTIWGERVRSVYKGGITIDHDSETDLRKMEARFAGVEWIEGEIGDDPVDVNNFYLRDATKVNYTDEEILGLLNNLRSSVMGDLDNLIIKTKDPNGLELAQKVISANGIVLKEIYSIEKEED